MVKRRRGPARGTRRDYPRTARVGELLREIIGEELEDIDDDRLQGVVVTEVEVDPEIRTGMVFWDSRYGPDADEEVLEALGEHRVRIQASINRQAHLRRTPELTFRPDPAVREGAHIEELLAEMGPVPGADGESAAGAAGDDGSSSREGVTDDGVAPEEP